MLQTPDFGWLEHELEFLKPEVPVDSPKNSTEHSGGSPRSTLGLIDNDPILRTPGSEGDGDAFPFRRDSATSDDKPADDVFVKPAIPDRLLKGKQAAGKSPPQDDTNMLQGAW